MISRLLPLAALAGLVACGQPSLTQPDGGRSRAQCTNEPASIVVKVEDSAGLPVEGATVTATNPGTGESITGTTNGQGTTQAVNQEIGPGTVHVRATLGSRQSDTRQVNWVCGECLCTADPSSLVLELGN